MQYDPSEFDGMQFNPLAIKDRADILDTYPLLKDIFVGLLDSFDSKVMSATKAIKYVLLAYSYDSPLLQKNRTNVIARKRDAASLAGLPFKKGDGKPTEHTAQVIRNRVPIVNYMIMRYVNFQNSMDFADMMALMDAYQSMRHALLDEEEESRDTAQDRAKKMAEVAKRMQSVRDQIEDLAKKCFKQDTDLVDSIGSYMDRENSEWNITPEQWSPIIASRVPIS